MSRESQGDEMKCQVYFLKTIRFINDEESFNSVGEFLRNEDDCLTFMDIKIKALMSEMKEGMNKETNHRAVTICIEKKLNDLNYTDKVLVQQVVTYSKVSFKFWKILQRYQRSRELNKEVADMKSLAFNYCSNGDTDQELNSDDDDYDEDGSGDIFFINERNTRSVLDSDLYFE